MIRTHKKKRKESTELSKQYQVLCHNQKILLGKQRYQCDKKKWARLLYNDRKSHISY